MPDKSHKIKELIDQANHIVVVQADNPDADSLGSALALEGVLGDQGKRVTMYCGVDMPSYLRYMSGWDRVVKDVPIGFDLSIIVDASTMTLLEKLTKSGQGAWLAAKPCIVLDHHEVVENPIPYATITLNQPNNSSTGELIYELAKQLDLGLSQATQGFIMNSILGDTQGLTNQLASARTYEIMAEMIQSGVSRPELEEARREYSKMPPEIFKYKAKLIDHTELHQAIALVVVPQTEINTYSPLYNPAAVIQGDMLQISGIKVAIVLKRYDDGKVTAAIRCNPGAPIAASLADKFGGGGHTFASGFKVEACQDFDSLKRDCLDKAEQLLAKADQD